MQQKSVHVWLLNFSHLKSIIDAGPGIKRGIKSDSSSHAETISAGSEHVGLAELCLETPRRANRNRRPTETDGSRGLRGGRLGGVKLIPDSS